jgi:hypothetical protein
VQSFFFCNYPTARETRARFYNNPQARTAANNPLPTTGLSLLAAPVGVADASDDPLVVSVAAFSIATPETPVPFWH